MAEEVAAAEEVCQFFKKRFSVTEVIPDFFPSGYGGGGGAYSGTFLIFDADETDIDLGGYGGSGGYGGGGYNQGGGGGYGSSGGGGYSGGYGGQSGGGGGYNQGGYSNGL